MSEPLFEHHVFGTAEDYHELNAGAHRKPFKNLNAPALVWHLAFWTNADRRETKAPNENLKEEPDQIKDVLDKFILTLCQSVERNFGKVDFDPCISNVRLLFNNVCPDTSFIPTKIPLDTRQKDIFKSTSRAVSLKFRWNDLDAAIRFEIHTEYLSISTFIELDKKRTGPPYSKLLDLNNNIRDMLKYLGSGNKELAKPLNGYFFRDFWKAYETEVLSEPSLRSLMREGPFQQVFADFRGLVLSEQAIKFPEDAEFLAGDKLPTWGSEAKSKFLPLIQDQRRYECAVNYMLDGRSFYMSTLGPQLPSVPVTERIPLEFIVFANQRSEDSKTIINKWQLGRLVSQLLLLGTLRLCALKDVNLLHNAGRDLGRLDQSTQAAREAIASKKNQLTASKKDQPNALKEGAAALRGDQTIASDENRAMELIQDAHVMLNGITGKFLTVTGSGLLYRIERSRYYVKQFNDTVKLLRIRRLEGDQPYNQFIERRLGSEFDFIDRLGIRYERAMRNMVTLDQNYLAITQNALVEKANRIDEETNSIQSDIHTIQEWGEFALLAALVPYYVMHLLDLIIKEKYVPVLTASVWTVFGVIALYRKFKKLEYVAFFLTVAVPVVAAVAWPLLFDPVVGGSILRAYEMPEKQLQTQEEILEIQKKLKKLADEQLVVLKDLVDSKKRPDEQKPDRPVPATPGPTPKP
jgi:hypothetical protein